jgi:hypothetical protein
LAHPPNGASIKAGLGADPAMIVFQFPIGTVYPWALGLVLVLVKDKRQKTRD